MSDSRLYIPIKHHDFQYEIKSISFKHPPIGILKKLLANFISIGDIYSNDEIIWSFILKCYKMYNNHKIINQLTYNLLEMRLNGSYGIIKENLEWIGELIEYLNKNECFGKLELLSCISDKCVSDDIYKEVVSVLWDYICDKLDGGNDDTMVIHSCIRLVKKLDNNNNNKNNNKNKDKIDLLFDKLMKLLNNCKNYEIISSIADTLLEIEKYSTKRIQLNNGNVSTLITIITNERPTSSIISLLVKFKIDKVDQLCKDVITCIESFMKDNDDISIMVNTIKCIIYYLNGVEKDGKFYMKIVNEIIMSFRRMFEKFINDRIVFFNLLRNFLLIVIKFNINDEYKEIIEKFIIIDENKDIEYYIIDTKLEILYLICLNGEKDTNEYIIRQLKPLIKSSNDNISYKTIRTLCNLIIKDDEKFEKLLNELINEEGITMDKHYLSISIALREVNEKNMQKYGEVFLGKVGNDINIDNRYINDEDIISYIWILNRLNKIEELVDIKGKLIKRMDGDTIDKKTYIFDTYLTSIVKSSIDIGYESDKLLSIMGDISGISKQLEIRVNYYIRLMISCQGDYKMLREILKRNSSISTNTNSGLDDDTVDEMCFVMGSIASVYLRPVHTVFK